MTEEKQIEEMAFDICVARKANYSDGCRVCSKNESCLYQDIACDLYRAGYRKQSWISVDERLPSLESTRSDGYHRPRSVRVLCACKQKSGKVFAKEGFYEIWGSGISWRIPGSIDSVTHWMPLPEPPKMKGGE